MGPRSLKSDGVNRARMVSSYAVPHGLIEVERLLNLDGGLVFLDALSVKPAGEPLDPSVVGISSAHRSVHGAAGVGMSLESIKVGGSHKHRSTFFRRKCFHNQKHSVSQLFQIKPTTGSECYQDRQ